MTACVVLLALLASGAVIAQSPPYGLFRTRTDLVALDVAVKDRAGRFVETLTAGDFLVLEDNVPQKVLFFSPGGRVPLAVVLLVDDSQSMAGEPLARAKGAAGTFLRGLRPDDLVEVIAFNDVPIRVYPMGRDKAAAEQAIDRLVARGGTRLYEAILMAQRDLERAVGTSAREYQKSIVLLSDGEDTRSRLTFEGLLDDARQSTTSINAISLRKDARHRWLPPVRQLIQLTRDTGGQTIAIRRLDDLTAAYDCIKEDLRQQYRLGYVSSSPDKEGGWRRISVALRDSSLVARTRAGYLAPWTVSPRPAE